MDGRMQKLQLVASDSSSQLDYARVISTPIIIIIIIVGTIQYTNFIFSRVPFSGATSCSEASLYRPC